MDATAPDVLGPVASVFLLTDVAGAALGFWHAPSMLFIAGLALLLTMLATPDTWLSR